MSDPMPKIIVFGRNGKFCRWGFISLDQSSGHACLRIESKSREVQTELLMTVFAHFASDDVRDKFRICCCMENGALGLFLIENLDKNGKPWLPIAPKPIRRCTEALRKRIFRGIEEALHDEDWKVRVAVYA